MPETMVVHENPHGYYSSEDKNVVRRYFDLPLLEAFQRRKQGYLSYFGLPGAEALDLRTWSHLLNYVAAVDRSRAYLEQLERLLDIQLPHIRYTTHWGELDKVILTDRGKRRTVGEQEYRPPVSNAYERSIQRYAWRFDIVNLDYFGTFIPPDTPGAEGRARDRANALRKLFDIDRLDAWQSWILLVTIEAELFGKDDKALLRAYLEAARADASAELLRVLDFLLAENSGSAEEAMRLVHGATAVMVSVAGSNANLLVRPRGTVLYHGAHDQPMVHLAFEFEPASVPLSGPVPRLRLVRAPILRPINPSTEPWFELVHQQCPGLTRDYLRGCLDFLESSWLEEMVSREVEGLAN